MRTKRIEETTEANRVAAASVAPGRGSAAPEVAFEARAASLLPAVVRLLSGCPAPSRIVALARASELLVRALGADRVGIYLPDPAGGSPVAAERDIARFVLAASFAAPGSGGRAREGDARIVEGIELSRDDEAGRRLLAGRSVRAFRPLDLSLSHFRSTPGPLATPGWSRVHATLQVPCPGPAGPVALIILDGPILATRAARDLECHVEAAASLLAGFLERDRLVRELAALRSERSHTERLAALGRVASSVAHDLNNVLTAIVGHADLLELELPGGFEHALGSPAGQDLEEIRTAAARGARLVEEVLAYGRKRASSDEPVDLARALAQLENMLHRVAGGAIELKLVVEEGLPLVRLDLERFERILLNLVVNGRHAIESGGGRPGRIELRLDRAREGDAAAGVEHVRLRVCDNGCGMDGALQRRVFEPFFTTRGAEGGTGLGLADVADFAHQTGATIAVESAPDAGCEIELRFPPAGSTPRIAPAPAPLRPPSLVPAPMLAPPR